MLSKKLEILLVEDNPVFVKLLGHAFKEFFELPYQFRHLIDGESAVRFLNSYTRKGPANRKNLPAFVLLDLNLPGKNGMEVLSEVRSSVFFDGMPVLILSSSEEQEEMDKCLRIGAQAFYVKPIAYDGLEQLVKELQGFSRNLLSKA